MEEKRTLTNNSLEIKVTENEGVCDKFVGKKLMQQPCAPRNPPIGYS